MNDDEYAQGLRRIAKFPPEEIVTAARLPDHEQMFLVEAAALLNIRPLAEGETIEAGPNVVEIDWRSWGKP